jgi:small subunit ribosomal protein S19e
MSKLVEAIKKEKTIEMPEWAKFVKTGTHVERPPVQDDWWFIRAASLLRKVRKYGPIGTNRLAKHYGGRKNRGNRPDKKANASRKIIRVALQQLEKAGFIQQVTTPKSGKVLTKKGTDFLNKNK